MKEKSTFTRSCPVSPEAERLREWVIIAGHWHANDHKGSPRIIDEAVLLFCISGGGWFRLRNTEYRIHTGDLFLCPPNMEHQYGCEPETGWEIQWCHFNGEHAESMCRISGLSESTPVLQPSGPEKLSVCFSELLRRLDGNEHNMEIEASGLLHLLLLELYRQSGKTDQQNDLTRYANESAKTVNEMAQRAGYSKFHFCRLFKKQTGRSPWQYVLDRKIEWAKELLIGSRLSIKEISAQLDFDNPDYFARLFRERTGVNPGKYRGH